MFRVVMTSWSLIVEAMRACAQGESGGPCPPGGGLGGPSAPPGQPGGAGAVGGAFGLPRAAGFNFRAMI